MTLTLQGRSGFLTSWSTYIYSFIHSLKSIEIENSLHNILKQILNRCFNMTREWIDYKIAIAIYFSGLFCSSCNLNLFIHSWNSIKIELILHNICNQILKRCFTITREQIAYKIAVSTYILVCEEGRFGQDCALKCNTTCRGCNNVNGVCENGCITGLKGVYCHEGLIRFPSITLLWQKWYCLFQR